MPFITQDRREIINSRGLHTLTEMQKGDICYVFYRDIVVEWKRHPSWTTAHKIYADMHQALSGTVQTDFYTAYQLAWQVFFQLYVMPYELKKREENGDI